MSHEQCRFQNENSAFKVMMIKLFILSLLDIATAIWWHWVFVYKKVDVFPKMFSNLQNSSFLKDSKTLAAKEKEVKKIADGLHALQEASNKDAEALAAAQQHFNAVSAGLSSNEDGAEATLAGQMMACKNDISKAQTEAKQVKGDITCDKKLHFTLCIGS